MFPGERPHHDVATAVGSKSAFLAVGPALPPVRNWTLWVGPSECFLTTAFFVACLVLVELPCPFAGIVPTITSPLQVVTLFTPFTGLNIVPAIVLGTSIAVSPWPLHLLYHVAFRVLDPTFSSHPDIH